MWRSQALGVMLLALGCGGGGGGGGGGGPSCPPYRGDSWAALRRGDFCYADSYLGDCDRSGRYATNTGTDREHCGACGAACPAADVCYDGACVPPCPAGSARCGTSVCQSLTASLDHCGECGAVCNPQEVCVAGHCEPPTCPPGLTACSRDCVDLRQDDAQCGACGFACGAGERCVDGACTCSDPTRTCLGHLRCASSAPGGNSCTACGLRCPDGAACDHGRCLGPALRMLAPISTMSLTSARPWFRWVLPEGAEGARLQVCATPSCDVVEATWETEGSRLRAPVPIRPGVHFWRLFAMRQGALVGGPGPVWEFVVPDHFGGAPVALGDINRDGLPDRVEGVTVGSGETSTVEIQIYFGRPGGASAPPDQRVPMGPALWIDRRDLPFFLRTMTRNLYGVAITDMNGDGFGDVALTENASTSLQGSPTQLTLRSSLQIHAGGPSGISALPLGDSFGGLESHDMQPAVLYQSALGDVDGDGFGDASFQRTPTFTGQRVGVLRGGALRVQGAVTIGALDSTLGFTFGDFDADGSTDVVTNPYPWDGSGNNVLVDYGPAASAPWSHRAFPACTPAGTTPGPHPTYTVLDANDDGYDDLRVNVVAYFPPADDVLYYGGPNGLRTEGCVVFSTRR